jgi:hypothetical protein
LSPDNVYFMPDEALAAVPAVPAGTGWEPGRFAAPAIAFVNTH